MDQNWICCYDEGSLEHYNSGLVGCIIVIRLALFQCLALLAANSIQSSMFSASSAASCTLMMWDDMLFFNVAIQKASRPSTVILRTCSRNSAPGIS